MNLPKRDVMATLFVAAAGALYWLWAADSALPGLESVRATGTVVLVLGFAASASAVVPGFEALVHGNKLYMAVTAAMGVIAVAGGLLMLVSSSEFGLGVLVAAMGALWLVATIHHWMLAAAEGGRGAVRPPMHPRPA